MSDLAPLAEAVAVDPLVGHPPDYHVFHKFLERCKTLPAITTAVVLAPVGRGPAAAPSKPPPKSLIEPTFIGAEAEMKALAAKIGVDISSLPDPPCRNRGQGRRTRAWPCAAPATPRP